MLDSAAFFQSFDKAGFLKTALWTPSDGGPQQSARVRLRAPSRDALAGEFSVTDHSIRYPATLLEGLKRGETLLIEGAEYRVREGPHSLYDGSVREAFLTKL